MLSLSFLQKTAVKFQTSELNVRREYVQHLLLSYLYQKLESRELYFKGGTALRILYRSPRFSEDLGFDTTVHKQQVWERVIEDTLIDVSREGIGVEIEESKVTSGGYLGIVSLSNIGDPIKIHFEISFRKDLIEGEAFTVENDLVVPYFVKSLTTTQLVDGKVEALLQRQKARDFYDLYFMLRANLLSPIQKKQLLKVRQLLSKKGINFETELALFLPRSQAMIIHDFNKSLLGEINRNI